MTNTSPHAHHVLTEAGELLDSDGSHCVKCACWQCIDGEEPEQVAR